jgi:hypothetical protein
MLREDKKILNLSPQVLGSGIQQPGSYLLLCLQLFLFFLEHTEG